MLLERVFWDAIDDISGGNWEGWIMNALANKRGGVGRATYLRTLLFVEANLRKINIRHVTIG